MNYHSLKKVALPLVQSLLKIDNEDALMAFLRDIMTEKEIIEFSQRLDIARRLSEGQSYVHIQQEVGVSSTTVARVAKYVNGRYGGYRSVLG